MGDGIDEQQNVPRMQMDFDSLLDRIERPAFADGMFIGVRMLEIRFVTAGNHHRRAVARPDLAERHQNIDLPAMKLPVVKPELRPFGALVSARMDPDRFTGTPQIGEGFIDEKGAMVRIERFLAAHECFDFFDPSRVIDQGLEGLAGFINLLKIAPVFRSETMFAHPAPPIIPLHCGHGIEHAIAGSDLLRRERVAKYEIPAQIEAVPFERSDSG